MAHAGRDEQPHRRASRSRYRIVIGLTLWGAALQMPSIADAASCPFTRSTGSLPETTLFQNVGRTIALFDARLRRDVDGAPNAYHSCGANFADATCSTGQFGLDHICNGVVVVDATGARVPPSERLNGEDRASSRRCLSTFRAAQAADYPECGRNLPCVREWPGVVLTSRPATPGYQSRIPFVRQEGPYTGYYVSQTTLGRSDASAPGGRAFLDARRIPYVVVPGASILTRDPWRFGSGSRADLALVIARNERGVLRATFAVVGETGPADETGEVSVAVLQLLRGASLLEERPRPGEIPGPQFSSPATIILFTSGTGSPSVGGWPARDLTFRDIQDAGQIALSRAGGIGQFAACASLPDDLSAVQFATE